MPILQKFLASAKEEFADAVANGGGIYAVGYCFGAKYVLRLSAELSDTEAHGQVSDTEPGIVKKEPAIKAAAIAHGEANLALKTLVLI
jgi:dienelactone hydrolase